jgi:hypothetical protein
LYILAVTGSAICSIILAGFASNSIYAFLGCLRAAAQVISYELAMGFIILTVVISAGSLNPMTIVEKQEKFGILYRFFLLFICFTLGREKKWAATPCKERKQSNGLLRRGGNPMGRTHFRKASGQHASMLYYIRLRADEGASLYTRTHKRMSTYIYI